MFSKIMTSQDEYYATTSVNNNNNRTSLNGVSFSKQLLPDLRSSSSREEKSYADGVIMNAGFSILSNGMRVPFKAKYFPMPAHKTPDTGSARLSAKITNFLRRSDHAVDERVKHNKCRKYSGNSQTFSLSFSLNHSLSGSTDSLASLEKSEAGFSLVDEEMKPESLPTSDNAIASFIDSVPNDPSSLLLVTGISKLEEITVETESEENIVKFERKNYGDETVYSRRRSTTRNVLPSPPVLGRVTKSSLDFELKGSEESSEDFTLYKERLRRSREELEAMKHKMLLKESSFRDKLILLKNGLEAKSSEAVERTEEQRQIVSKLRKELQSLSRDYADVKCLLQEETGKSVNLEKRLRLLVEEQAKGKALLGKEKAIAKELSRDKAEALSQAEFLRTEFHRLKLDLHLKEERLKTLEEEMSETLRMRDEESTKAMSTFQSKLKKQEEEYELVVEELNEMKTGKQRLEEQMEQTRRKQKVEAERHDGELEELTDFTMKKIKGLEFQLSAAQDERVSLLRSKKELETKLLEIHVVGQSEGGQVTVEELNRLRQELKGKKTLLKDAQLAVDDSKTNDMNNKAIIRQLKNCLQQADGEKQQLLRLRTKVEEEYQDTVYQLQDSTRAQIEAELLNRKLIRENARFQMTLEESNHELTDVRKMYQTTLENLAIEKSSLADQTILSQKLTTANGILKEKIIQLTRRVEALEDEQKELQNHCRKTLHLKVGEFKSRMKVEEITKRRAEDQMERLKWHLSSAQEDIKDLQIDKKTALELVKVAEKQAREATDERKALRDSFDEMKAKNAKLQKQLEISTSESNSLRVELKSSLKRMNEVKEAMSACNEDSDDDTLPISDSILVD